MKTAASPLNGSVVLFMDAGFERSQQMFADLNKHAVRPTRSLGVLYDHRDPLSKRSAELISRRAASCQSGRSR